MADILYLREDYQDLILACMMRHPHEFMYVTAAMKYNYFSGVLPTLCAKAMLDHAAKYSVFPTWEILQQRLEDDTRQMHEAESTGVQDYVTKIAELDTSGWESVRDRISEWLRERALVHAIRKAAEMLKEDNIPGDGYASMFLDAMQVGQNLDDLGYVLNGQNFTDIDKVVKEVTDVEYGLATGFGQIDRIWPHGWGPGWLVVPAAPPKRHKSLFCINLAMNVASPSIGEDVIYYACELNQTQAMVRAMCHVANLGDDYMFESSEKFTLAVKNACRERLINNVIFKSFSSKNATIADLRAHAHTVKSQLGIKPRLIIIDYAETIQPSDKKAAEYRQQSSIYIEARAFAQEMGATVVMPDRVTRDTVDRPVPDARALQGAFEKAGIVDVAFGLAATDEEYLNRTVRFFNFLNRHGPAFQHLRGKVDPVTWHMDFTEIIGYDPEAANESKNKRAARQQHSTNRNPPTEMTDY